jgi:uncharacterized protein YndB with AHSA1/START domain
VPILGQTGTVAYTARVVDAPSAEVFAVIVEPRTYPRWLLGAQEIRDVDDDWPSVGSGFRHRVGVGSITIPDDSRVLAFVPGELLRLKVRARPLVTAIATFAVVDAGERCVVTLEEEPTLRVIGNIVRPMLDPTIHMRNHRSLRRLADVVADGQAARSHRGSLNEKG